MDSSLSSFPPIFPVNRVISQIERVDTARNEVAVHNYVSNAGAVSVESVYQVYDKSAQVHRVEVQAPKVDFTV